ncbi:DUF1722 domain-containing protein [Candidatus Bathyarchaeota archaeon]|nr:DUF1722 domain-containing protein [Candidatus Bathyarchaeota archaeon]
MRLREFVKPNVVISKCITFENVRWNAQIIASDFVEKLKPFVNFIPVYPEVQIGLSVPRDPLRIVLVNGVKRLIQPATGLDFTEKTQNFAESFLSSLREVDGFILKSGSPSSGFKNVKIYPNIGKSASIARGRGFFGGAVVEKFPNLAIEDEKRLLNLRIREHFLTKLYTHASFRMVKKSSSIRELIRFHSENKLLLTAYNQKELRILGRVVANQEDASFNQLIELYQTHLFGAFERSPSIGANINVMMKAMGCFSKELSKEEKRFFLELLERYKATNVPLSACLSVLKAWVIRFEQEYLMQQTFFEPFPGELMKLEIVEKDYWKK